MKNKIINRIKITTISSIVILAVVSCQKSMEPGATSAVKVANTWWCHLLDSDGNELLPYAELSTYNTAANNDSMWIDDETNLAIFKVKAQFSNDGTFQTSNSPNAYYSDYASFDAPETVTITDGKVLSKAGHSKTGLVVDSIYMKIVFSNDPDTYLIEGTAQTGWDADSY